MTASIYNWKILKRDEKLHTKNQTSRRLKELSFLMKGITSMIILGGQIVYDDDKDFMYF